MYHFLHCTALLFSLQIKLFFSELQSEWDGESIEENVEEEDEVKTVLVYILRCTSFALKHSPEVSLDRLRKSMISLYL